MPVAGMRAYASLKAKKTLEYICRVRKLYYLWQRLEDNIMRKISIDVKNYPSGSYLVEIKGCYDNLMQAKVVKL